MKTKWLAAALALAATSCAVTCAAADADTDYAALYAQTHPAQRAPPAAPTTTLEQQVRDARTPAEMARLTATLEAAEVKFEICVQSLRVPEWAEFAEHPETMEALNQPVWKAWAARFTAAAHQVTVRCQQREVDATTTVAKMMGMPQDPGAQLFLEVIAGDVMNGHTSCDATHCITSSTKFSCHADGSCDTSPQTEIQP